MQNTPGTSVFREFCLNDFVIVTIGILFIAFYLRLGDMHSDYN